MEERERTIDFKGRKTEISYHHLKQEYPDIVRKYGNLSQLKIDFSQSSIKQNAVERVMKDLFMIHEIEDDKFQHKFYFLEHLQIKAVETLFTNLNFVSNFFIYKNIKSIKIDCDLKLAINLLKVAKESHKIELIDCSPYFTKTFDIYSILCNAMIVEGDITGIEDQIDYLQLQFEKNNYSKFLSTLELCKSMTKLKFEVITMEDVQKDFKRLIKTLQTSLPLLQDLDIDLDLQELVPPIKKEKFQSPLTLSLNYKYRLAGVDLKSLLRKIHRFADQNDSLIIYPYCEYKNYELNLNFQNRILEQEEQKQLLKFISKCNHKLVSFTLLFDIKQEISNKRWVDIINHLGSYEELKFVKINGTQVSNSVASLSVAKLMKCRKTNIEIKGQTFYNNILSLKIHQLSDYSLQVICDNIFDSKSSRITSLDLTANQIIGQLQPLSKYFSKCQYYMDQFKLTILSMTEMQEYFLILLKDVQNIQKFTQALSFSQQNNLKLNVNAVQIQAKVDEQYSLRYISNSNMPQDFSITLMNLLQPISSYSSIQNGPFDQYIQLYSIYCTFWKLYDIWRYQKSKPTQMLAFYTIISSELQNNPYQVYTDLYYD